MNALEEEILISLAWHVRVLSVEQLARAWWSGLATGERLASKFVKAWSTTDWLHVRYVLSRKSTPLAEPLEVWHPEAPVPDFAELSRLLHRRARTPTRKFRIVTASRKCRELFGVVGGAHRPKLTQLSHELFVAEATANEGPTIKRWRPRAQGRAFPINKPMTHVTVVVENREA